MNSVTVTEIDQQVKRKQDQFEDLLIEVFQRSKEGDQTAKLIMELIENVKKILPDVFSDIMRLISEEKIQEARVQLAQALHIDNLFEQKFFYTYPRISKEYETASSDFNKNLHTLTNIIPQELMPHLNELEEATSTIESEVAEYSYKIGFYEAIKYLEKTLS